MIDSISKLVVTIAVVLIKKYDILLELKNELPMINILSDSLKYSLKWIVLYKYAIKCNVDYIFHKFIEFVI